MNNRKFELYFFSILFFVGLTGITIYFGTRTKILLHAYENGNAAIIPACITFGYKSPGYDFSINGELYSTSLSLTRNRSDIYIDSMDVIYLKDHPWFNMPACDVIDCKKCLPYSDDFNRDLLRKGGVKLRVKPYIDEDKHRYAYKFINGGCTYYGNIGGFSVNPDTRYIRDSVTIVFWPNNPNLNEAAYLLSANQK